MNEQYLGSFIPDNHCGETPQHVDKPGHLSDPTSTTDSTSLVFPLQDTYSVEIEFVPEFEEHLNNANLSQTDVFLNHISMNSSSCIKRLIHHLASLAIRKVIYVKTYGKMTPSSLIQQTLAQDLHYPISWYNTTMKT